MANTRISMVFQCDKIILPVPDRALRSGGTVVFRTSGGMRQFAIRAGMVHRHRELMGKKLRDLVDRDIVLGGELLDGVVAKHLPYLVGRDRQVLAGPDPGLHLVAQSSLL